MILPDECQPVAQRRKRYIDSDTHEVYEKEGEREKERVEREKRDR
jgi:hypothetical protein